ncbi:hypothetical protein GF325_07095 [Candidatus Bathyarchaeota archaeon]|nr:hypothetical protein [Candidatus Bathyarchaeota archaeon]
MACYILQDGILVEKITTEDARDGQFRDVIKDRAPHFDNSIIMEYNFLKSALGEENYARVSTGYSVHVTKCDDDLALMFLNAGSEKADLVSKAVQKIKREFMAYYTSSRSIDFRQPATLSAFVPRLKRLMETASDNMKGSLLTRVNEVPLPDGTELVSLIMQNLHPVEISLAIMEIVPCNGVPCPIKLESRHFIHQDHGCIFTKHPNIMPLEAREIEFTMSEPEEPNMSCDFVLHYDILHSGNDSTAATARVYQLNKK